MIGRMIKALGGITICALAASIPLPSAAADTDPGLYVQYSGGVSFVRNQNLKGNDSSGSSLSGHSEQDTGFNFGLALGKRFFEHLRGDIEFTYRRSEVDALSLQGEPDNASGSLGVFALMANAYVDWDLDIGVVPYAGFGIGWASVDYDAKNNAGALKAKVDGRDSVFAWSLMTGGSYPVTEVLDLSLGYRYFATTDPKINSNVKNLGSRRLEGEYDSHEIVLGLRFNF